MPAIITNIFRINNEQQLEESFTESSNDVYYLGIGGNTPFTTPTRADGRTEYQGSDTSPITPSDTPITQSSFYDDMIAAKRITGSDVAFVVPRRNWITGTVYDYYRHDYGEIETGSTSTTITSDSSATTLYDATFYVLTTARNVYKCIDNNGGAASTVEPTGTSTVILTTADGYKWKYMYTLSASEQTNFLSTDFMPVTKNSNAASGQSTVISAAVDGAIDLIKIKSAGSGSSVDDTFTGISIRGDGTGGVCSVTVSGGAVTSVTVTSSGSGYTFATVSNADIVSAGATSLTGAELDVIIPPKGGHGSNAIEELGAFFLMLNTNLEGTETANSGDFSVVNDFRKITLIKNPTSGGSALSSTTARVTKAIAIASSPTPGTFVVDEEINQTSTGAVGRVVEWDATNSILYYVQTKFNDYGADSNGDLTSFSGSNVITGQSSSATGTPDTSQSGTVNNVSFTSGYSSPELDHDSGDILYVENRAPIQRAVDQTENIKMIIEF
jgi:hypothetical protein